MRAYIATSSIGVAAHELDIAESTARQHLSALYRRSGCSNAAQAAYWLGAGAVVRRPGGRATATAELLTVAVTTGGSGYGSTATGGGPAVKMAPTTSQPEPS